MLLQNMEKFFIDELNKRIMAEEKNGKQTSAFHRLRGENRENEKRLDVKLRVVSITYNNREKWIKNGREDR